MRLLKKSILYLIGFLITHFLHAQSGVTFDGSQVFSTFKFVNSEGALDKNFSSISGSAYNLGYLHTTKHRILLGGGIGLRKAGASKVVNETDITWNLQYAEAKFQVGYLFDKWRVSPVVLLSPYFASLLNANESIGGKYYDIKSQNLINKTDLGITTSLGVNIKLSDYIYMYSFYNQIFGLKNIEVNPNQKQYNRGFSLTLGLAFTINKLSPKWIQ